MSLRKLVQINVLYVCSYFPLVETDNLVKIDVNYLFDKHRLRDFPSSSVQTAPLVEIAQHMNQILNPIDDWNEVHPQRVQMVLLLLDLTLETGS